MLTGWCRATGIFELIASIIIFIMGISMLKMDRAKAKWRVKLQRAFAGKGNQFTTLVENTTVVLTSITTAEDRGSKTGKYVLFILPLITVLREGKP